MLMYHPLTGSGHAAWTALLRTHVRLVRGGQATQVAYAGFKTDRAALKAYLDSLSAVPAAAFGAWSKPERQAFLINAVLETPAAALTDQSDGWACLRLEGAGAEGLIIGANSMHRLYDDVAASVNIPILHIAEYVGLAMKRAGIASAALLGTRNVMTESFYRKRLVAHGIDLLPPNLDYVEMLDRIIYDELMVGKVTREAERTLKTIITNKAQEGATAIVLACTELDLVVDVDANVLPIFDGTRIHAQAAVDWILG